MSKLTPQPSNYFFKQISIGPAPNILNEDKSSHTSFTTLDQLKKIDRKVKKGCLSIASDTDDTKSSVADDDVKECDLGEDVAYEDDPGEDDIESNFNDTNDYNDGNDNDDQGNDDIDSKSTKEIKSGKTTISTVKKTRFKTQEKIELKKEKIDDSW